MPSWQLIMINNESKDLTPHGPRNSSQPEAILLKFIFYAFGVLFFLAVLEIHRPWGLIYAKQAPTAEMYPQSFWNVILRQGLTHLHRLTLNLLCGPHWPQSCDSPVLSEIWLARVTDVKQDAWLHLPDLTVGILRFTSTACSHDLLRSFTFHSCNTHKS